MRLISFASDSGPRIAAVASDGSWVDLNEADPGLPAGMCKFLALGRDGLRRAAAALETGKRVARDKVRLLPPVPRPEKIICIGLNYADHARETGKEAPAEPVVFNKLQPALRAAGDPIVLPRLSSKVDYEAELVVGIGARGRHIPKEKALEDVAGYTCGNDLSARDRGRRPHVADTSPFKADWVAHKSFDGSCPLGPWIVPASDIKDPQNLAMKLWVNDTIKQDSNTGRMIYTLAEQIAHLSSRLTLHPGDLIMTGTPAGVGAGRGEYLKAGDVVKIWIEGIGEISNKIA